MNCNFLAFLQVIVQYSELELIMHPAIRRLLDVKWDLFGKWSSIWIVLVNMTYTFLWTVLGLMLPRDGNYYRPLSKYWWRLVLECVGCIMTVYFILTVRCHSKAHSCHFLTPFHCNVKSDPSFATIRLSSWSNRKNSPNPQEDE